MKVMIVGLNYAPERIGIAAYTTGMARYLQDRGHHVKVVAGQPYYPAWKPFAGFGKWQFSRRREQGIEITRVPHFIPSRPTASGRIVQHLSFAAAALVPVLWRAIRWRPDAIIAVAPSLIASPLAWLASKVCGAPTWLHSHDIEVDAAVATGLLPPRSLAVKAAQSFETAMLKKFDIVSAISPQMCARLTAHGLAPSRIVQFRNWADIDPDTSGHPPSLYRNAWDIATPHVALYAGSLGAKQGLELIIEAARVLKSRQDLTFVVCGEGPMRAHLERAAHDLPNLKVFDLQPRARLAELLSLASIHLLPQTSQMADLVLPSKLTNMLASGRPVVATASPETGLAIEIKGCGLATTPGHALDFADAIVRLCDNSNLRESLGQAARRRAQERWSKSAILSQFENRLADLARRRPERASHARPA